MLRLFKEAEKARHIDSNPARGVEVPAGKKAKEKVVPTAKQIQALLKVRTCEPGLSSPCWSTPACGSPKR
jgi:hypothetical protein